MVTFIKEIFVLVGVCVLIFHSGLSEISVIKNNEPASSINTNFVKILNTCFQENLNPLIITKDISYQFRQLSSLDRIIPLIIVDGNLQPQNDYRHYPKLATFAISANSVQETENIFLTLEVSIWWSIDAVFLLVGSNSCDQASAILNSAWQKKLLSVIYICRYSLNGTVMIYTYNPFTNRAPSPWTIVHNSEKLVNTWTLYKRRLDDGVNLCQKLVYDKLKYMDGYHLKGFTPASYYSKRNPDQDYDLSSFSKGFPQNNVAFFSNLFAVWNFTVKINYLFKLDRYHNYDMTLFFPKLTWYENASFSYPFQQLSVTIVTKKRSIFTPVEKIVSFYSIEAILLICTLFGTIIMALIFIKPQPFSSACLEVIRLVVATSVRQSLQSRPIRIFFFGVFWFFLIFNATFTGNLVKFLTKPDRPSIESLSDLHNFDEVFIHPMVYELHKNELLSINKLIRFYTYKDKFSDLLNNSKTALLLSSQFAYIVALDHKLHVSKEFNYYYTTPCVGPRFPFIKQIEEFAFRWFESGLLKFWDYQEIYRKKEKLSNIESEETEIYIRPITLSDLSFAFKFLAFSLGCSFIVFIMEISSADEKKKRRRKVRRGRK